MSEPRSQRHVTLNTMKPQEKTSFPQSFFLDPFPLYIISNFFMLRIQVLCLAAILGGVGAFAPPGAGIALLRQGNSCRAVTFSRDAHAQKLKDYGYNIIDVAAKSGTTTLSKDPAPASMGVSCSARVRACECVNLVSTRTHIEGRVRTR